MEPNLDEIRSKRFPGALHGYARAAVDDVVTRLSDAVEQLRLRLAQLETDRESERTRLSGELEADNVRRAEFDQQLRQARTERDEIVAALDEINAEREARASYVERLEQELGRYRELEQSLTGAIVAAERSGNDARAHADREATLILEHARTEARRIVFEASAERERLLADVRRIRTLLASAQAAFDGQVYETEDHRTGGAAETFGAGG